MSRDLKGTVVVETLRGETSEEAVGVVEVVRNRNRKDTGWVV